MTFGEATRALRKALGWVWESSEGKTLSAIEATFHAVVQENNALRRNNERLTAENKRMSEELARLRASERTAKTMAAHWRIEAKGGDYDATQEDEP